jgi:hypothetical protein
VAAIAADPLMEITAAKEISPRVFMVVSLIDKGCTFSVPGYSDTIR